MTNPESPPQTPSSSNIPYMPISPITRVVLSAGCAALITGCTAFMGHAAVPVIIAGSLLSFAKDIYTFLATPPLSK